ncbi:hypothetical protein [Bradyrhizobium sp. UFLA05-112]
MKVKELIELLSTCEQDADVIIPDSFSSRRAFAVVKAVQTGWTFNPQLAIEDMSFWIDGVEYAEPPRGSHIARGVRLLGPKCGPVLAFQ